MIVVDTNVIAAAVLPTSGQTAKARALLEADRDWVAPLLWRSELCNVLATGVRAGWFDGGQAMAALGAAGELMRGGDFSVPAADVLKLAIASGCTAYDCEFVVLARDLAVKLVTLDQAILRAFPEIAVSLDSAFRSNAD
ncbi:MAG: type II toxin-antitoxin system VapC family toxin [Thermoanaerobaculaceae bacterium]